MDINHRRIEGQFDKLSTAAGCRLGGYRIVPVVRGRTAGLFRCAKTGHRQRRGARARSGDRVEHHWSRGPHRHAPAAGRDIQPPGFVECSGQVFPDTDYGDQAACCSITIGDR